MSSASNSELSHDAASRPTAKRLRVLIADDDRDAAASLEVLLNDEGHHTFCVYRGSDVLRMVNDFKPDVVLLDIGMPGMSGYDVALDLRERYGSEKPALIAVTAWAKLADKLMAKYTGIDHHVTKPYDPQALLELITCIGDPACRRERAAPEEDERELPTLRYSFEETPDYLRAELVGRRTAAETEAFLRVLLAKAEEQRCTRVLVCVRRSHAIFQVERYHVSEYFAWLVSHPNVRVALLADSRELHAAHEYIEVLARQRGAQVRSYTREEEAVRWLRAGLSDAP